MTEEKFLEMHGFGLEDVQDLKFEDGACSGASICVLPNGVRAPVTQEVKEDLLGWGEFQRHNTKMEWLRVNTPWVFDYSSTDEEEN